MNQLDYVLNNGERMDEKTAETLIISWISASVKEGTEAMKGIMTPFQKTMMKQVLTYLRELSERMEAMDIIIETYRATHTLFSFIVVPSKRNDLDIKSS